VKTCNGCKYADWKKTAAGRLHPSGNGRCKFQYTIPALPASMYFIGADPSPCGGFINRKETFKDHCAYYQGAAPTPPGAQG
jgi:hypothetical protein